MPAGNVAGGLGPRGNRSFARRSNLPIVLRREENKYFLLSRSRLIGEKHVAGVLQQDELGARDPARDQFSVACGYQGV